jgi:gas vesicle protein
MPKKQERERSNAMPVHFPSAGNLIHGQALAVQNATRMTGQVCHQVMSMNKAWFDLWSTLITEIAALPKRFTSAQVDYIGHVLSSFKETGREMGNLVLHAEEEAEGTFRETAKEAGRSIREWQRAPEQAAKTLQSTINPKRQKGERGTRQSTERGNQDRPH